MLGNCFCVFMYSNKLFFGSKNRARFVNKVIRPIINYILLVILLLLVLAVISRIGFNWEPFRLLTRVINSYHIIFTIAGLIYLIRAIICIGFKSYTLELAVFGFLSLFILIAFSFDFDKQISWLNNFYFYSFVAILLLIFELSRFDIRHISLFLNPAQLFIISFGLIIVIGSFMLMLPAATVHPISLIDALFTSTSAVCVTGLTVVDTGHDFTLLGKSIILILIQVGGIGIMTFTSFFGYFFKGGSSSFSEKFLLSDFFSEENVSEIAKTLTKVIFITLMIEGIGALLIFLSLEQSYFPSIERRIHIAVFHSIAAFCNAGFSTLDSNIYSISTRNNIPLLYSLSFLIILGGIGFPILLNFYTYLKFKFSSFISYLVRGTKKAAIPQLININTRLVLVTTVFLLVVGTIFFFIFEKHNTIEGMSLSSKIAHSFFSSVTPRTAGFNSIDYSRLSTAAIVLTIFLMWVGASPVSTGGGIKTSTFSIAILNALRIARMKRHIEFNKREIHERSVNRAFTIIILSILILGCASLILHLLEPQKGALQVLFECVSAFGTVGLSLGITPELKDYSKLLLVALMFIGRMGILTMLFAIFRKTKPAVFRYPKENIVIN